LTSSIHASDRRAARLAGLLFIATFVTAIAARVLFDPARTDLDYVIGAGADTRVLAGAAMELGLIIANIGTAVVLFGVVRRQSETLALGYVTARLVECTFIAVGLLSLLAASGLLVLLGAFDAGSVAQGVMSLPEIAWEASLGIYLAVKGFKASAPILARA
jgi:hypothetical protein